MSDDRHQTRSQASPHAPLLTGVGILVGAVSHGMLNVVRRKPVLFGEPSGRALVAATEECCLLLGVPLTSTPSRRPPLPSPEPWWHVICAAVGGYCSHELGAFYDDTSDWMDVSVLGLGRREPPPLARARPRRAARRRRSTRRPTAGSQRGPTSISARSASVRAPGRRRPTALPPPPPPPPTRARRVQTRSCGPRESWPSAASSASSLRPRRPSTGSSRKTRGRCSPPRIMSTGWLRLRRCWQKQRQQGRRRQGRSCSEPSPRPFQRRSSGLGTFRKRCQCRGRHQRLTPSP